MRAPATIFSCLLENPGRLCWLHTPATNPHLTIRTDQSAAALAFAVAGAELFGCVRRAAAVVEGLPAVTIEDVAAQLRKDSGKVD